MDAAGDNSPVCMWQPDPSRVTNMDSYRVKINEKFGLNLGNVMPNLAPTDLHFMTHRRERSGAVFIF